MNVATVSTRQRLSEVRKRTREAREQRQRARAMLEAEQSANDQQGMAVATLALNEAQAELEIAESLERVLLSSMAGVSSPTTSSFLDSPEALSALERFATSSHPIGRQELGQFMSVEDATLLTGKALAAVPGTVAPTGGMERGQFGGIIPTPTPPTTFLDLCPSAPMSAGSMPYATEVSTGDRTAGAAPVEPGQIKPPATIEYKDAEAKPETIAAFVKCQKQTLADVDQLTTRIQTRLMAGVLAEVENQVLSGDGVSPNLLGLLNVDGTVSVPYDAAAVPPDAILDGIAACLTNGAQPNVVALSIADWTTILKSKASGTGEYLGSPFLAPASSLWSLPMVPCVGVPPGQALVVDTSIALTVLWREGMHVLSRTRTKTT